MRKLITIGMAVAMLAVPTAAMADAPDGTYTVDPKVNENASVVGLASSQIKQNGQWVSGKYTGLDGWQDQRGDRSAQVQTMLGHDK
jgi:polyisoprenoid-binding protein YceI